MTPSNPSPHGSGNSEEKEAGKNVRAREEWKTLKNKTTTKSQGLLNQHAQSSYDLKETKAACYTGPAPACTRHAAQGLLQPAPGLYIMVPNLVFLWNF